VDAVTKAANEIVKGLNNLSDGWFEREIQPDLCVSDDGIAVRSREEWGADVTSLIK
jgi:hypothetical protein